MDRADVVLETHGLAKSFGAVAAIKGVDLEVRRGELFGFLGQNGAGKTTTIRILARLVRADAGDARLLGHDVATAPVETLFRRVGFLVETPMFFAGLSGVDNLVLHARLLGLDRAAARANDVLSRVGLSGVGGRKVGGWSLGMRQRLGLAQALLGDPDLLVLDEPTNGLDPRGIWEIRELLRAEANEHGRTVFLSSHLLSEVEALCSRIAIVDQGRVVAEGAVADLVAGANGRGARFRTSDDSRARAVLAAAGMINGPALIRKDGAVEIDASDDASCALAVRLLVQAGLDVHEVAPARRTLEDVYRGLVGGAPS